MFKRQLNLPGNTPAPGRNYIYIYIILYYIILYYIILYYIILYYIYILYYIIYILYIYIYPVSIIHPRNPTWNFPLPPFPTRHLHLPNFRHPEARLPARLPTRQPWCQQTTEDLAIKKLVVQLIIEGIREEYHGISATIWLGDTWGPKKLGDWDFTCFLHPKLIVSRFHKGITMQ